MKKLTFLLTTLLLAGTIVSCDKEVTNDIEGVNTKVAYVLNDNSRPISDGLITPAILAVDKPRGGNITCADVAQAYNTTFVLCGDKLDFGNYDSDTDLEFNGEFPEWLDVTVTDGKFVSFTVNNSGDVCYQVGAVIVKGSNSANVYFYGDGTQSDSGLAAPLNNSGTPAGLSNLTFCFVECKKDFVIAVKAVYKMPYTCTVGTCFKNVFAVSDGTVYPFTCDPYIGKWGVNNYSGTDSYDLVNLFGESIVAGAINVTDFMAGDDHILQIDVTLNDGMLFTASYIYVGPLEGLNNCPDYTIWPNKQFTASNTHTYYINYNDIPL